MSEAGAAAVEAAGLRRVAAAAALAWGVAVALSLTWNLWQQRHHTRELAQNTAREHFAMNQGFRRWVASHGGVYVPVDERTPPNPYLGHYPEREIETPSGRLLTLMNPAYVLRQFLGEYRGRYGLRARITSLRPLNPGNAPDPWERRALEGFAANGGEERFEFIDDPAEPQLRLMRPLYVQPECLKCHAAQGYDEGDLRGGIGVILPLAPFLAAESRVKATLAISHALFWSIGTALIVLLFRRARRRLAERQRTQEELRHSAALLEEAQRIAGMGNWGWEIGSGRLYWSEQIYRIFGHRPGAFEPGYEAFLEAVHPDDREAVTGAVAAALAGERPYEIEHRILLPGGGERLVHERGEVFRDRQGQPMRMVGMVQDVTERHALERELIEQERMMNHQARLAAMGELLSMIAHQWRQPLTALNTAGIELAVENSLGKVDGARIDRFTGYLQEQTAAMSRTIDEFMELSRPDRERVAFAPFKLVENVGRLMEAQLRRHGLKLVNRIDPQLRLEGFPHELEQVLLNLIANARDAYLDHGREAGEIVAAAESGERELFLCVEDRAGGMAREVAERLFEPYFTTKEPGRGTGLGLYLARRIVERSFGGQLEAEHFPGGVRMRLRLPAVDEG